MKFKLQSNYLPQVQQILQQNNIQFITSHIEDEDALLVELSYPQSTSSHLSHQVALKLLQQFQKTKISQPDLTINQWLSQYNNKLKNISISSLHIKSFNEIILLDRIEDLKKKLKIKKSSLQEQLVKNKELKQQFEQAVSSEENKAILTLQNVSLRLSHEKEHENKSQEEFQRIKNVIKNGIWGLDNKIAEKLKRKKQLEKEINII